MPVNAKQCKACNNRNVLRSIEYFNSLDFCYDYKPSASPNAGEISGGHHHSGANFFLYGLQQ